MVIIGYVEDTSVVIEFLSCHVATIFMDYCVCLQTNKRSVFVLHNQSKNLFYICRLADLLAVMIIPRCTNFFCILSEKIILNNCTFVVFHRMSHFRILFL